MEPPKFAIGIGLKKVSNHWCMIKVDDNMEMVDKPLPLFYETDGLYSPRSVRSCSSIDGEFIWIYAIKGRNLSICCIREDGEWKSKSKDSAIGLKPVIQKNRIYINHWAWVTKNGNFCITNEKSRYFHEMDNEDDYKPDIEVYQISPNYEPVEGEYILPDHGESNGDVEKTIGRWRFKSYYHRGGASTRSMLGPSNTGKRFENIWEYPDEMDYKVEYPEQKIELDES